MAELFRPRVFRFSVGQKKSFVDLYLPFLCRPSCQQKSVYNSMRGWVRPIFTNAFLEQIKNNMQNLSNTKVFKKTKGCLKNLARAKNKMRAQKK